MLGFFLLAALPAHAAAIRSAHYDARRDEIVVEIAYRGESPHHDFDVKWGPCAKAGVSARLVDRQGGEAARAPFVARERLPLRDLPCRPAQVTIRLGAASHATVRVSQPLSEPGR
jgi:hypothetical protein